MGNEWLTDELMQRAAKLIQDIDGIASQGTIYVVSRALYEAEKRGREEAAKVAEETFTEASVRKNAKGRPYSSGQVAIHASMRIAAAIRSGQ